MFIKQLKMKQQPKYFLHLHQEKKSFENEIWSRDEFGSHFRGSWITVFSYKRKNKAN